MQIVDVDQQSDHEDAAPGTDVPASPALKAPEAPGNELLQQDYEAFDADPDAYEAVDEHKDSSADYWQPGQYYAPPVYAPGWYYHDIQGQTQGPFVKQQLQLWRQHLPMNLRVWFIDQNGGSSHSLELAKVLGDGKLLESWRKAQPTEVALASSLLAIDIASVLYSNIPSVELTLSLTVGKLCSISTA